MCVFFRKYELGFYLLLLGFLKEEIYQSQDCLRDFMCLPATKPFVSFALLFSIVLKGVY